MVTLPSGATSMHHQQPYVRSDQSVYAFCATPYRQLVKGTDGGESEAAAVGFNLRFCGGGKEALPWWPPPPPYLERVTSWWLRRLKATEYTLP
ncbi:uncharacterized protein VTP21DRAFT_5359 [Calcarisporiella thermophila]|uniref:uncharacterized protein n=1 Tax=Calcarisporiella thermophila TaxID=911321 RepID=UPI003743769B